MIFPTYGSVFACILLSSVFMIVVCLLGNRINFILKNSANLLVFFMIMVMLRMFFPCNEYSYAAEPPVQFRLSHLSRRSEPL